MRRTYLLLSALLISISAFCQTEISNWISTGAVPVTQHPFVLGKSLDQVDYSEKTAFSDMQINLSKIKPSKGESFQWGNDESIVWKEYKADSAGFINIIGDENDAVSYFATWVEIKSVQNLRFDIESPQFADLYLNSQKLCSINKLADSNKTCKANGALKLNRGKYLLLVRSYSPKININEWKLKVRLTSQTTPEPIFSLNSDKPININQLLEGPKNGSAILSPDGAYFLMNYSQVDPKTDKTIRWVELRRLSDNKIIQEFRGNEMSGMRWMPIGHRLYKLRKGFHGGEIVVYDFESGSSMTVAEGLKDVNWITWSPDESYFIFSKSEGEIKNKKGSLIYMDGLSNRYGYSRRVSSLFKYDIATGFYTRLTYTENSVSLSDISLDGKRILFTTSKPNPTKRPFRLGSCYLMNLENGKVDTLWKDLSNSGYPSFSPDGEKLLVSGGPDLFNGIGRNVGENKYANNYDGQLFIYNLETKEVDPITIDFDPCINSAHWHKSNNKIYVYVGEKIYSRVYAYDLKKKEFELVPVDADYLSSLNIASDALVATVKGNGVNEPNKTYLLNLKKMESEVLDTKEYDTYSDYRTGGDENWDFVKEDGTTISGYVAYPPNFDRTKKYPLIVYYYGGTTPVEKSFGGRYPFNVWAANGYVIYCPQPSGAIGFGQEFSARHQNDWGKTTADEIIEGTKKFIAEHDFIDEEKIGCNGASYGGFMTMYLQTRTDIFTCAIAHAGISSISSYWGEGDYGAGYSANASAESYPWNNKELYVERSPLFNADKIKTPMLLLHGTEDENVPMGESVQMYVGLKILGAPVEMVKIDGERHQILTHSKRIEWHNMMLAWFDLWLKGEGDNWKELFPNSKYE